MAGNQLCGLNFQGSGTYTAAGIIKLCEGLKGSVVTSLKCAAARAFAFVSAPIDTPLSHSSRLCSCARSLGHNNFGLQGGAALAEGLKANTTLRSLE